MSSHRSRFASLLPYLVLPGVVLLVSIGAFLWLDPRGSHAPDFALPIVAGAGAEEGDRIALADLRGHVVVLDFWASWCGPCRESIPILNRVRRAVPEERVAFVGINVEADLTPQLLASAHAAFGAEFPSVQDGDGSLQQGYQVTGFPTVVVIGPDGTVHQSISGVPREQVLLDEIRSLLE